MPELDGVEVAKRIRRDEDLAGIPMVGVTALAGPGFREQALNAGFDECLMKPMAIPELLRTVKSRLN